jgi:hypothetical protein
VPESGRFASRKARLKGSSRGAAAQGVRAVTLSVSLNQTSRRRHECPVPLSAATRPSSSPCFFWTNNISKRPGRIKKRHAWASGMVALVANPRHGLVADGSMSEPFNSLSDLGPAAERLLIRAEVKLHTTGRTAKLLRLAPRG